MPSLSPFNPPPINGLQKERILKPLSGRVLPLDKTGFQPFQDHWHAVTKPNPAHEKPSPEKSSKENLNHLGSKREGQKQYSFALTPEALVRNSAMLHPEEVDHALNLFSEESSMSLGWDLNIPRKPNTMIPKPLPAPAVKPLMGTPIVTSRPPVPKKLPPEPDFEDA